MQVFVSIWRFHYWELTIALLPDCKRNAVASGALETARDSRRRSSSRTELSSRRSANKKSDCFRRRSCYEVSTMNLSFKNDEPQFQANVMQVSKMNLIFNWKLKLLNPTLYFRYAGRKRCSEVFNERLSTELNNPRAKISTCRRLSSPHASEVI